MYALLSSEGTGDGPSLSIDSQQTQLRKRAEELGPDNPLFLFDDSISSAKNNRPQFQKALELVKMRKACSFMVTGLSLLYQNQAYVNEPIKETFPSLYVRLIFTTEGYDFLTNGPGNNDMAMFSNLFNEYYPRMTSRKINTLIHTRCENGVRIASISPYSYQKDPEDKNKVVPEPVAYAWRAFGQNHSCLNSDHPCAWRDGTVVCILENPDYIGTQVDRKTIRYPIRATRSHRHPRRNRTGLKTSMNRLLTRKPGRLFRRFEPSNRLHLTKMGEIDVLAGIVFCAHCDHVLHLCPCGSRNESQHTFVCGPIIATTRSIRRIPSRCCIYVSRHWQEVCQQVQEAREGFLERILRKKESRAKKELTTKQKTLQRLHKPLKEVERENSDVDNVNQFLAVVDRHLNLQKLTPALVHEFVSVSSSISVPCLPRRNTTPRPWAFVSAILKNWHKKEEGMLREHSLHDEIENMLF